MKQFYYFTRRSVSASVAILFLTILFSAVTFAQTTAFTYQGRLSDNGNAAPTGTYDLQFALFDQNGAAIGTAQTVEDVAVTNGIFTVSLDFGATPFTGNTARSLEIGVRPGNSTGAFTTLAPRQPLTSTPYAIRALSAANADTATTATTATTADSATTATNATNATNAVNATTAATAGNVTGIVAIANGGTGSSTQNFVDLTTNQAVGGNKTFNDLTTLTGGAKLQNSATDPEAASAANAGRVYYNTAINSLRFSDGARWVTAGQPIVYHVYNTVGRASTATSTLTVQPGMTQTITVPTGFTANVVINASIGAINAATTANAYSVVDFAVRLDNGLLPKGAFNRFSILNTAAATNSFNTSTINTAVNIGAGTHTIDVVTARSSGTVAVTIGGNPATEVNAGEMTLTVYYTPITFVNRPAGEETTTPAAIDPNNPMSRGTISPNVP